MPHDVARTEHALPLSSSKPWLLPLLLVVGAVAGFTIGGLWGEAIVSGDMPFFAGFLKLLGDLFMNALKMIVVPLIVCSMIVGMAALSEQHKVGKTFGYTFLYYFSTTLIAVSIGLVLVSIVHPGVGFGVDASVRSESVRVIRWYDALFDLVRGLVPSNLVEAAAKGNILGLLVFSLVFGGILTRIGEPGQKVIELAEAVNEVLMRIVRFLVWLAPLGIIGLVAYRVGQEGGGQAVWSELGRLAKYFLTVLGGLTIHAAFVLPLLLWIFTRRNPIRHAGHFAEPMLTAFSTASSAATLPLTIRSAEQNAGLDTKTSRFVLPLGATINMDGTALYEAVAVVFIAEAYGIHLSGAQLVVVLLTATLAAVGAAAIPQAGLVTMVMVLTAVHVPVEGVGILLSVDWLLDRFRTAINVWGDSVGAAIISEKFGKNPPD